ncbi:hypothetical protein [Azospirillum canadense]|uniref:hypothetical protein n=1 Tax=Azospirillum canadense TaxID=403962 RepID=UPI0022270D72|nr:hypothetical protein [Azospirillum canadense]MCW2243581.1 hypothetical protein [Azospirillum canadense]
MAGLLWRLNGSGNRARWGRGRIIITGVAGWDLNDVPAALSGAVTELVKLRWYEKERGDPLLRSYENPDVERLTYMDADKMPMEGGLPTAVYDQLAPYRSAVFA